MSSPQPLLFTPLQLGNVRLKNRICISPMCQYVSQDDEGLVTDWHLVHLGARAAGGAGIVMLEATAVEKRGRMTTRCIGLWCDAQIGPLRRLTEFIKSQGAVPAIQLAHSGRKGSQCLPWIAYEKPLRPEDGAWKTIAPSPIPFDAPADGPPPHEATLEDIKTLKQSFVSAACRAIEAGFQIIELHFAYGCLVASYLSPYSNHRTDEYGGSFENRIRFGLELIREVQAAIPFETPLFIRLCCDENLPPAMPHWGLDESVQLCKRLKELGVHLVDCTSGGNSSQHECFSNVDQISMAARIQHEVGIPTAAVGGIVSGKWAERILQRRRATLIMIGRASLDDSAWPQHAADELGVGAELPNPYKWAIGEPWRSTEMRDHNRRQLANDQD